MDPKKDVNTPSRKKSLASSVLDFSDSKTGLNHAHRTPIPNIMVGTVSVSEIISATLSIVNSI
jgi:hypothetical protein